MSGPGSWDACPHCGEVHAEHVLVCPNTERALALEGRLLAGKFRVLGKLGEGGMSTVWRAENVLVRKRVALKLMHPEYAGNPRTLERFRNEATSAGRIGSHHICDILDFGESALGPFIVMELLTGQSLADLLDRHGRVDPGFAVHAVRQALVGLGAAHAAGIIHRDLKPENVFLHEPQPGRLVVKLMDFGISKFTEGAGQGKTGAGVLMGTPDYMSPEQAEGAANVDARTDIWAMGVMLYRAIAGEEPFLGPTLAATLLAVTTKDPKPLAQLCPDVDPGLAQVVHGCLAKDPQARIASAEALSGALAPYEVPGLVPARPNASVAASVSAPASASAPASSSARETPQSNPSSPPTYVPESIGPVPPAAESKETWSNEIGEGAAGGAGESWTMGAEEVEERHESLSGSSRGGGMGLIVVVLFALFGGVGGFFLYRAGTFDSLLGGGANTATSGAVAGDEDAAGSTGGDDETAGTTTGSAAETSGLDDSGETGVAETGGDTQGGEGAETGAGEEGGAEGGEEGGAEGGADTGAGDTGADTGGGETKPPFQASKVVSAGTLHAPRQLGPRGNWRKAGGYCRGLNAKKFAGITSWRRASVAELLKFRNKQGISKTKYWSRETSGNDATAVLLLDGSPRKYPKSENSPRAFCVGRR